MNAQQIGALALLLAALGFALLALLACGRIVAARRTGRALEARLATHGTRATVDARSTADSPPATTATRASSAEPGAPADAASGGAPQAARPSSLAGFADALASMGVRWLDTPAGRLIVAQEDRRVLDQCGYIDARSCSIFLAARIGCALGFGALVAWLIASYGPSRFPVALICAGAVAGFMVPKLWLRRRARARIEAVENELPMFVDLLRLLQGVGLSLDQSLQVMVNDFKRVLPVLAGETEIAQRQFIAGRTREQSFQRMASIYENEDLRAVTRLLVQVDRYGGAVQEPLKQFGERLREVRRAALRERVGALMVKMTGVMVITLLPALMIVTAGPGVVAVTRSLTSLHH